MKKKKEIKTKRHKFPLVFDYKKNLSLKIIKTAISQRFECQQIVKEILLI